MNNQEEQQKEFVKKLLALQQKRQDKPLSKSEQQEIAFQIGLSDSDWQAVQETYKAHLLRGRGFLSHQNYDDAISELEQANVLDYNSIETTAVLAQTHFERFNEYSDEKDKEAAISYSNICLNHNPSHTPSLKIISELKRKDKKQTIAISKEKQTLNKWIIVGVPLLFIFVIISYVYLNSADSYVSPSHLSVTETEIAEMIEMNTEMDKQMEQAEDIMASFAIDKKIDFSANEYEIPVEVDDKKLENLEWQTESSLLTKFDESYKIEVKGDFLIKNAEINELKIKLEFFDDKGQLIKNTYQKAVEESDLVLRKGDLIPFQVMEYEEITAPNIAKIVLSSAFIAQKELPKVINYEISPKIPVSWEQKRPQNINVQLRERQSRFSNGIIGGGYHHITLEIENTGNTPISHLKFRFRWFNAAKKLVGKEVRYGVSKSTSKLKRNQIRILSTVMTVPKVKKEEIPNLTYEVEVIEVK